jgi:hypothetical protein
MSAGILPASSYLKRFTKQHRKNETLHRSRGKLPTGKMPALTVYFYWFRVLIERSI